MENMVFHKRECLFPANLTSLAKSFQGNYCLIETTFRCLTLG
jgi:hypothetical protein